MKPRYSAHSSEPEELEPLTQERIAARQEQVKRAMLLFTPEARRTSEEHKKCPKYQAFRAIAGKARERKEQPK